MRTIYKTKKYFLQSSEDFFNNNSKSRIIFLKKFNFLFQEISNYVNNCVNNSKKILFYCCGNFTISDKIKSEQKFIHEILSDKTSENLYVESLEQYDHIIVADIEHQKNITKNFLKLSNKISDECRIIIISKSLIWSFIIKLYKIIFPKYAPSTYNFIPYNNLKSYIDICNLEIVRNEKVIFFPFKIPILTNLLNFLFQLPILNFFCLINITVTKKKGTQNLYKNKISYIIPCKNEDKNISKFEDEIKNYPEKEFIFGDDKSTDNTKSEILKLCDKYKNVKYFEGPGICKSENVFKGCDLATGDILVIYDADLTTKFSDINMAVEILRSSNSDIINCSRMIYPQEEKAMKKLNFFGNIMFAKFFSIIFQKKITDTLCGTKIFFKKDWNKLKMYVSRWGPKDHWGDFDLLLSAYKNNFKITEVPVHYYNRDGGDTKMTNLISNTLRMLSIVICGFCKIKLFK